MTTPATDCPPCPACGLPSVCGPDRAGPTALVCGGCGLLWTGTPAQRAQAACADAAYEALIAAEEERLREHAQRQKDRERAREMFTAAGVPLPAWLREESDDAG